VSAAAWALPPSSSASNPNRQLRIQGDTEL
jgi:hypothetical protein